MKWTTGQVAVAGAAAPLAASATEVHQVVLKAPATNANPVFVGPSGVTTATGFALDPGETLPLRPQHSIIEAAIHVDPAQIYACGTSGDKLTWLAFLA